MSAGPRRVARRPRHIRRGCAMIPCLALLGAALWGAPAAADPVLLRMASVAPEGTAWARELHAFSREVAAETHDQVHIKWYLSGIAGNELTADARVKRDQLDGVVSGGMLCQRLSPSLRAASMAGEFRDDGEARYVMAHLRPLMAQEFSRAGYQLLATGGMGFSVLFSRKPVRSLAELKKLRPWLWDLDEVLERQLTGMGVPVVLLPVEAAGRAFDEGKVDSFLALPSAALAFQWSTQSRYVANLRIGYLSGCILVAHRAWDMLSHDDRQVLESAVAKTEMRLDDLSRRTDAMLLGGLLARQGLTALPVSAAFEGEFEQAALRARPAVSALMPPGLVERVAGWIDEYRKQRRGEKR